MDAGREGAGRRRDGFLLPGMLAAAALTGLLLQRAQGPPASGATPVPAAAESPGPPAPEGVPDAPVLDAPADTGRVSVTAGRAFGEARADRPPPAEPVRRVRVRGRALEHGGPAVDRGLAFHALEDGRPAEDEADWDITCEEGRYEVRLGAGSYVVLDDEGGARAVTVSIPEGIEELDLDIDLVARGSGTQR